MTDDFDLEARLRAHYRDLEPGPVPSGWQHRIERRLERGARPASGARRLAILAAAAVFVLVGVVGGVRLLGRLSTTAGPSPSASVGTVAPPSQNPLESVLVEHAGAFGPHGVWAMRGSQLLVSSDSGLTWTAGSAPIPTVTDSHSVFVATMVDANLGFVVASGPSTTTFTGNSTDLQPLVVYRTTDGGKSWTSSNLPGNFPGVTVSIAFANSQRGFIYLAPFHPSSTPATVLATTDGGVTWVEAGSNTTWRIQPGPGAEFAVGGSTTLVAGANTGSVLDDYALLATSSDGGSSWHSTSLPGLVGRTGGHSTYFPEPPVLSTGGSGMAAVVDMLASGATTHIFRSSDSGISWSAVGSIPIQAVALMVLDDSHALVVGQDPGGLFETADGGATWNPMTARGLPDNGFAIAAGGIDATHAWMHAYDTSIGPVLLLTSDGGRSWTRAGLGSLPASAETTPPATSSPIEPSPSAVPAGPTPIPSPSAAAPFPPAAWGTLSTGQLSPGPSGTNQVVAWSGGWIAFDSETQATAWFSHDGRVWSALAHDTFEQATSFLGAVSVGSELLVFTEDDAAQDTVWRTSDGQAWTSTPIQNVAYGAGAFASNDSTVLAIRNGGGGGLLRSPDGVAWSAVTTADGAPFYPSSVIYRADVGFVAVGFSDKRRAAAWTSQDGRDWAPATVKGGTAANGVALGALISGRDGLMSIGSSGGDPGLSYWVGAISGPVGHRQVSFSPSTAAPLGSYAGSPTGANPIGEFAGDGTWILAWGARANSTDNQLWASRDGTHWTQVKVDGGFGYADIRAAYPVGDAVLFGTRAGTPDWMGSVAGG